MSAIALALNLIVFGASAPSADPDAPQPSRLVLPVRVYNYSQGSKATILDAWQETSDLFEHAGIVLHLRYLHMADGSAQPGQPVPAIFRDPSGVHLRVLPRRMAAKLSFSSLGLGQALVSGSGSSNVASIDFDRARHVSRLEGFSLRSLLGHVMAHEIGHLLLGRGSHCGAGLMKATFPRAEMALADRRGLSFSRKQARQMHRALLRRFGVGARAIE